MLLWSEDRAGACNTNPADEKGCWELVMLHSVAANEGACATKTCLAVDGEDTRVPLTALQEFIYDELRSKRSNDEGESEMCWLQAGIKMILSR